MTTGTTNPLIDNEWARGQMAGPREWQDAVLARMAEGNCLMHAAALVARETPPPALCSLCGEHTIQVPAHELCKARVRLGVPIQPIPWTVPCYCYVCKGRTE